GLDPCQRHLIDRFYQTLASTKKVTAICGAGISTHAGIPDFRSEDGLLNRTFGDHQQLKGSELFESSTIRDHEKRKVFNQEMARMRVACRAVDLTSCHLLIEKLYDTGRLVRCYTQNIDGLQTRNRQDMEEAVFELHGSNMYLKCAICKTRPVQPPPKFDEQLLSLGYAACPTCMNNPARMAGNSKNLRCSQPGELLPDILLNDQVTELWKNGKRIDQLAIKDAQCQILLIIGTRLKPKGASSLAKALASHVRKSGGTVVYVDWHTLPPSSWSDYINLHIQMDLEEWAEGCLRALRGVSALVEETCTVCEGSSASAIQNQLGQKAKSEVKIKPLAVRGKKVRFALEVGNNMRAEEPPNKRVPMLLIIYHDVWAIFDSRVLAEMMEKACVAQGQECRHHIINVSEDAEPIMPPDWSSFYLVIVYMSSNTQFLHRKEPLESKEQRIMHILGYSSRLSGSAARNAIWSLAVVMCPEGELLSQPNLNRLNLQVKEELAFDAVIASIDLTRFRLGGWVSLILGILEQHPVRGEDYAAGILDQVTHSWMANGDLFDHSNLVVFNKWSPPYMLLAAPFDERPLGKALPEITSVCPCIEPDDMIRKRWAVQHSATDKLEMYKLKEQAGMYGHIMKDLLQFIEARYASSKLQQGKMDKKDETGQWQ
ncbi:unnamed protein product, partial [Rhizoctonia solani]